LEAKGIAFYFTTSLKRVHMIYKIHSAILGFLQPESQTNIHGEENKLILQLLIVSMLIIGTDTHWVGG
jgi:hypothetical protein